MLPLIPLAFLLVPYLVVNTTATLPVPLSVNVGTGGNATPVADPGTLTGVIGLAGATLYRWKQGHKRETVAAQTTAQVANSLKGTDVGVHQSLSAIHQAISLIPGVPQEAKDLLAKEAESWGNDLTAYYEKTTPNPNALSGDPIVRAQAAVQDITTKTED